MIKSFFDKAQLTFTFDEASWQRIVFNEFEATLLNDVRPFPCVFGFTGLQLNQLRYAFIEDERHGSIAMDSGATYIIAFERDVVQYD